MPALTQNRRHRSTGAFAQPLFPAQAQADEAEALAARIIAANHEIARLRIQEGRPETDPELLSARAHFAELQKLL
jgi:hypothetical protein